MNIVFDFEEEPIETINKINSEDKRKAVDYLYKRLDRYSRCLTCNDIMINDIISLSTDDENGNKKDYISGRFKVLSRCFHQYDEGPGLRIILSAEVDYEDDYYN